MSNRLANLSSCIPQSAYAQGATQAASPRAGRFLAPTVEVGTHIGTYKEWSEKNKFRLPDTRRPLGGRATALAWAAANKDFNCTPRSLDYPVDRAVGEADLTPLLNDGAQSVFEIAELEHEQLAITIALQAAGAGTAVDWRSDSVDPVEYIDAAILDLMKATRSAGMGVLFGAYAWHFFKNNPAVYNRCQGDVSFETAPGLFHNKSPYMAAYAMVDQNPEGLDEQIDFALGWEVLVFARAPKPSRRDPSFMKTFRVKEELLGAKVNPRGDGRVDVVAYDWSEDIRVTNTAGVARYNLVH